MNSKGGVDSPRYTPAVLNASPSLPTASATPPLLLDCDTLKQRKSIDKHPRHPFSICQMQLQVVCSFVFAVTKNYINHVLKQLTVDYQNTKQERKEIASLSPAAEEEFTVLEEIELLTTDIRGYASQIQARGWIENEQEAIERLQTMQVFDVPAIARVYFITDGDYMHMKAYIRMLDYLRLLILEYLRSHQNSQQESGQVE